MMLILKILNMFFKKVKQYYYDDEDYEYDTLKAMN